MGMRMEGASMSSSGVSQWQQSRQNFNQLAQALQSGNLSSAQQAYSSLAAGKANGVDPNSPLGKLGAALQSGDVNAAQQAFASLRSGHHHHSQASSSTATTQPALATSGSIGTNVNAIA